MRWIPVCVGLFLGSLGVRADLFKNTDFSASLAGWHGDGRMVYLAADGPEKDEAGTRPAINLKLSHDLPESRSGTTLKNWMSPSSNGRPNFRTGVAGEPGTGSLCASHVDFWIKGPPGFFYKIANLKPGQCTKVDSRFENLKPSDQFLCAAG
jgi:hypothetical protein